MNNETIELMRVLKNIKDESCLDEYLVDIYDKYKGLEFKTFFEDILKHKQITKSELIKNACIDRTYGYQILNGSKKPSRDKVIKLCIGASLDIKETNKALRLADCGELYSKNLRDAVIIFGVNKGIGILKLDELLYDRGLACLDD
ncbi:hypothetical protein [Romboutsia sp. MSSM.1001216sp_RTP31141st1_G3_RTP31141_220114]|uniref:hypothetical protein n=1 Tax=unclassified Romboutsia TaxID=2626894 RepID=UPI0031B58BDC